MVGRMDAMEPIASAGFCTIARLVSDAARRLDLKPPGFRSPPRASGAARAIRRYPGGHSVVAVRFRGRSRRDVVTDMVEGIIVANGLDGAHAAAARAALVAAAAADDDVVAPKGAAKRVAA